MVDFIFRCGGVLCLLPGGCFPSPGAEQALPKGRSILIALCLFFFPAGECCFGLLNDDYERGARSHAFGGCGGRRKIHGGSFSEAAANKRAFQALCKGFIIAGCRSIPLQKGESFSIFVLPTPILTTSDRKKISRVKIRLSAASPLECGTVHR